MVRKIVHGIETCEDCRKIFFLVIEPEYSSIRFNALLRLCRKTIDPKYSAPRLQRHLDGLEGKFVKRTKKGAQQVVYSLIIPKLDLGLQKLDLEQKAHKLHKLRLDQLVDLIMNLYTLIALEQIITDLESLLNKITSEQYSSKMIIIRNVLGLKMNQYSDAMKNRPVTEYNEVLKALKDERSKITNRLGGTKT
jgi:hypothetical protein